MIAAGLVINNNTRDPSDLLQAHWQYHRVTDAHNLVDSNCPQLTQGGRAPGRKGSGYPKLHSRTTGGFSSQWSSWPRTFWA
jgi:hypothetical protein